jgi:hypothetical protein
MPQGKHIRGREATYMAIENDKRRPIALDPAPNVSADSASVSHLPVEAGAHSWTAPPRVLKSGLRSVALNTSKRALRCASSAFCASVRAVLDNAKQGVRAPEDSSLGWPEPLRAFARP